MAMTQTSAGFSIIELLITLSLTLFAVVSISSLYASAGRLADRSTDFLDVHSIAHDKLVQYQNMPWINVPVDNDGDPIEDFVSVLPTTLPGPREAKVYISLLPGDLKAILVRVKYGSGAQQKTVEYADYIHVGGLGR